MRGNRQLSALIIGFAIVALAVASAFWLGVEQRRAYARVTHTIEVQRQLQTLLSVLQDAETGQRGYLLTGDVEFLDPYRDAAARLDTGLKALRPMLRDNPVQQARAAAFEARARRRLARLESGIDARRHGETPTFATLRAGKADMDAVRGLVATMASEEAQLLRQRDAAAARTANRFSLTIAACGLALLGLGIFAIDDARRRVRTASAQAEALRETNARLTAEAATRAAAEAQVRQLQKTEAISQLTGGIAHDFNNMLTIVIGSLDFASRQVDKDPARARQFIGNAMAGAERAAQLTARLLAFARQQPLAPSVVDVNKLVAGMSELLGRTLGGEVAIETTLADGLWPIFVDAPQLENAIVNLCVNARDAMPDGGRLILETGNAVLDQAYATSHAEVVAGQYALVSVSDTGSGMPPEVIERAFDPFFTTKAPTRGTGLGLSQVHGFVKQSGGHIKIYSEIGVGTTIRIYLPRHRGGDRDDAVDAVASAPPVAGQGQVILVVDDDQQVRDLTVASLIDLGYTVIAAADGDAALARLAEEARVDLMFTDVVMPGMNGRKLAERATALRPGLRVLFTTGYTRNAIVHNGVLDAGVDFLPKPFNLAQLAEKIGETLGRGTPEGDA